MTQSSADSIEAIARRLAQWIKYSWAGLGSGSIVDRGYPEWAGHAYQGGQDDLRRLAAELVALSAPAQAECEPVAWQYRIATPGCGWSPWHDTTKENAENYVRDLRFSVETRVLYAAPTQEAGMIRDALVAAQISELDDASNACLELASKHGFATGHGDTVADMIREFSAQIRTEPQALPTRQQIARIIDPAGMSDGIRLRWALEKADAILALSRPQSESK